jgi:hypothetical protein
LKVEGLSEERGVKEREIVEAVKDLLAGRVNELLGEIPFAVEPIEFSDKTGGGGMRPEIRLTECERTEKERIVREDAYSVTITFLCPQEDGDLYGYVYTSRLDQALREDPTLGGVAERATVIRKKYHPPRRANCGEPWEVVMTLRVLGGSWEEGVGSRE